MSTTALPDLFTRHAFAREGILDSDAEGLEGFFDLASGVLDKFAQAESEVAEKITTSRDYSDEAKSRLGGDFLSGARDRGLAKLDAGLAELRGNLSGVEAQIQAKAYPPPDHTIQAVTRSIAVSDALRQLEGMEHADRIRVVVQSASAGDLRPLEACERSLMPLIPGEVIARAREAYAFAKSGDLAQMRDRLRRQVEKAERVRLEAEGRMLLKVNRFMTKTKAA